MARNAPLSLPTSDAAPFIRAAEPAEPKRSLITRFFDALIDARERQAEREVARYLANRGETRQQSQA
jgi:hypothetical protein